VLIATNDKQTMPMIEGGIYTERYQINTI